MRLILDTVARQQKHFPGLTLIWRTQQPAGCGDAPIELPKVDKWLNENRKRMKYSNWKHQLQFDLEAKSFWAADGGASCVIPGSDATLCESGRSPR